MYTYYDDSPWYDLDSRNKRDRRRKRSTKNIFSAVKLVKTAVDFCGLSKGNILLMGGALSLPEISGFRSVRERSSDLDFIVNSDGLSQIESVCNLKRYDEASKSGAYMGNHDGVDLAFFLNDVKGFDVSGVFSRAVHKRTEFWDVFTVPYELNAALKVRRGSLKKRMYGKDGLDFAVSVHSKKLSFEDFSARVFASYLKSVCESCELGYRFACLYEFEKQVQNGLRLDERSLVFDKVSECRSALENQCRYKPS